MINTSTLATFDKIPWESEVLEREKLFRMGVLTYYK